MNVLVRGDFFADFLEPTAESIGPRLDGIDVAADGGERHSPDPAIQPLTDLGHGGFLPNLVDRGAMADHRRQLVMPFLVDLGPDLQDVADLAFHRKAAGIDLGRDPFDDDGAAAECRRFVGITHGFSSGL